MGVSAINDVLGSVGSERFRQCLTDCRNQHEILQSEIAKSLTMHGSETKDPPAAARGMSAMKSAYMVGTFVSLLDFIIPPRQNIILA